MFYLLDENHVPVMVCASEWRRKHHHVQVGEFTLPSGARVSTVFLGLDHNHSGIGPPILFETMIFGGPRDQYQQRYCTWEQAERGHGLAISIAMQSERMNTCPHCGAPGQKDKCNFCRNAIYVA